MTQVPPTLADVNRSLQGAAEAFSALSEKGQKCIGAIKAFSGHYYRKANEYAPIIYIVTLVAFSILLLYEKSWMSILCVLAGGMGRGINEYCGVGKKLQDHKWIWNDSPVNQIILILALTLLMPDRYTLGSFLLGSHFVGVVVKQMNTPPPEKQPGWLDYPILKYLKKTE